MNESTVVINQIRSSKREKTHIEILATGTDAQHVMRLIRDTLRRENVIRTHHGGNRISYRIETAAG